jgi:hypothetical protein
MSDTRAPQQPATQVPFVELLRAVPKGARLLVDDGAFSTSYYPVGLYCHAAADALAAPAAQQPAEPRCKHGIRHPHECRDCVAEAAALPDEWAENKAGKLTDERIDELWALIDAYADCHADRNGPIAEAYWKLARSNLRDALAALARPPAADNNRLRELREAHDGWLAGKFSAARLASVVGLYLAADNRTETQDHPAAVSGKEKTGVACPHCGGDLHLGDLQMEAARRAFGDPTKGVGLTATPKPVQDKKERSGQ